MFSPSKESDTPSKQPQKRKYVEYRDPDYDNGGSTSSKRSCDTHTEFSAANSKQIFDSNSKMSESNSKYNKIYEIISKEFEFEIELKQQQLAQIEERLSKAFHMLDRLRYAVVADYYRKQTVPLNPSDATTIRGQQTLFDKESSGPQMALHPSLKKIIGKKPKTYEEILRACPTRAAAQNAKHTILIKSKSSKKRDGRLKKLIKEEGIVIDHSKPITEPEINALKVFTTSDQVLNTPTLMETNEKSVTEPKTRTSQIQHSLSATTSTSLNASRLNNKKKHLIVVGNTSKYIECEREDNEQKLTSKTLSYKWLVYVQSKNPSEPLESFIKKIRFFLHSSYRPNDVVDICQPPFQISRRGWGEFPLRIQVFFHDFLQQKPVQLVHNLVLDKTLSGLETLGSETLVEIWLRSNKIEEIQESSTKKTAPVKQKSITTCTSTSPKGKNTSLEQKIIDDNLFEFLNKIEESPTSVFADIEKIQPTVLVTEPIANIVNASNNVVTKKESENVVSAECTNSIDDNSVAKKSPCEKPPLNHTINNHVSNKSSSILTIENTTNIQKPIVTTAENIKITPDKPSNMIPIGIPKGKSINVLKVLPKGNVPIVNIGKPSTSNTVNSCNGFKIVNSSNSISNQSHGTTITPKKILQKKLVQLVDVHGNVKYVQMLVATSAIRNVTPSSTPNNTLVQKAKSSNDLGVIADSSSSINSTSSDTNVMKNATHKLKTDFSEREGDGAKEQILSNSIPSNKTSSAFSNNVNSKPQNNSQIKNVVFEKEGKVYIIDPMQVKLKQEQKKQVSLLKPQVSLLKQNQPKVKDATTPTVGDHDYVPVVSKQSLKPESELKSTKYSQIMKSTPFLTRTMAPQVHHGIKQSRVNAGNALEILQKERLAFDQKFMKTTFISVREAVEYLLRQLPLVTTPNHKVSSALFPFINNSLNQFNALPAFKQRACEWLRAKYISRKLKAHKDLRKYNDSIDPTMNYLWTTREIAVFARHHAYTPIIKSLKIKSNDAVNQFKDLVKKELKNEQHIHYETITTNSCLQKWADEVLQNLNNQQEVLTENQYVDIVNLDSNDDYSAIKSENSLSPTKLSNSSQMLYLSTPEYLDNESQLVRDICKDTGVTLQPEEIIQGVVHPMTQTLLARCLRLFIEKLVRQTLGFKVSQQIIQGNSGNDFPSNIEPQDIAKVINMFPELDYLSNRHLGTTKIDEFTEI